MCGHCWHLLRIVTISTPKGKKEVGKISKEFVLTGKIY